MKILISPISLEEATAIIDGGADIIDIKNTQEGSLGAQFPWRVKEIVDFVHSKGFIASATLGDLPYKPGTAALAAYGLAHCKVNYVKAGLYGMNKVHEAQSMMVAIRDAIRMVDSEITIAASGYADYRRFDGLMPLDLVKAASDSGCDVVMVDTAIKDGKTLFDAMSIEELKEFVQAGQEAGMKVALAGSIGHQHAAYLEEIAPDIIGARGACCEGSDRTSSISVERTRAFVNLFRSRDPLDARSREAI